MNSCYFKNLAKVQNISGLDLPSFTFLCLMKCQMLKSFVAEQTHLIKVALGLESRLQVRFSSGRKITKSKSTCSTWLTAFDTPIGKKLYAARFRTSDRFWSFRKPYLRCWSRLSRRASFFSGEYCARRLHEQQFDDLHGTSDHEFLSLKAQKSFEKLLHYQAHTHY